MGVHIALLRGINVGGKHSLPMRDLTALFERAGATHVRTYIQSGNVVFAAPAPAAPRIAAGVSSAILKSTGMRIPVVTRSATELAAVIRGNPYLKAGLPATSLHVAFLADRPATARIAALDAGRSPGDAFSVRGRDVFLHLPNGTARSKLTNAWFDSSLGTVSTIRNWRTVLTLAAMAGG